MKVPFNINLSGKTAIVTGGSGTLCSAMAYGLAVCGAKVAIIGRNKEKLASVSEKLTKDALDEYNKNVTVKGYSCNVINKDELSAAYELLRMNSAAVIFSLMVQAATSLVQLLPSRC